MGKILVSSLFAFLILFLAFGCIAQQPTPSSNTSDNQTAPVVAKIPSFTLSSPANGETITTQEGSASITFKLSTKNLVTKPLGGQAKTGEGHFKIILDGNTVGTFASKTYQLDNIAPGEHTVKIELVNNDGKPYSPAIYKQITFTVIKEITVYSPADYTVVIHDFSYEPGTLTVKYSDRITFVNSGTFPRSATCRVGSTTVFDTTIIAPGKNSTVTMSTLGECDYFSLTYLLMKGKIIVNGNGVDN